jgi:hypothetical protein
MIPSSRPVRWQACYCVLDLDPSTRHCYCEAPPAQNYGWQETMMDVVRRSKHRQPLSPSAQDDHNPTQSRQAKNRKVPFHSFTRDRPRCAAFFTEKNSCRCLPVRTMLADRTATRM